MKLIKPCLTGLWLGYLLSFSAICHALESTPLQQHFIQRMVKTHRFDEAKLQALLKSAKLRKDVLSVISKPVEFHTPWYQYRQNLLTEQRINGGVQFWLENEKTLANISQSYGVPAQVIVAILGVESFYGKDTGRYRVLDTLSTLAFFYPKRSAFFLTELENFLLLCREENLNPLIPVGSYAGAMGTAQFMPSSIRTYSVDYDKDKHRDMIHNRFDILASVANYLAKYGWIREQEAAHPVTAKGEDYQKALLSDGLLPDFTLAQLKALNIAIPAQLDLKLKAKLLNFEQKQGNELWIGLTNFYVISRYNRSAFYTMAVYQLSAAILAKKRSLNES